METFFLGVQIPPDIVQNVLGTPRRQHWRIKGGLFIELFRGVIDILKKGGLFSFFLLTVMILSRSPWKSSEDLRRLTRLFSRNSAWELAIVANPFFNLFRKEGEELQERWKSASPPFFFFFPVSAISFNSRNHLVAML